MRRLVLLALLLPAFGARGQGLAGRVVLGPWRQPAAHAVVVLADDSARVVAAAQTDSAGMFALAGGRPGAYRLLFFRAGGPSAVTPPLQLDTVAAYAELLVQIPGDSSGGRRPLYRATDVDRTAVPKPREKVPLPRYPREQARRGIRGLVRVLFIVDERGYPETASFRVVGATHEAFIDPVRDAVFDMRLRPAERAGRPVPQLVELTFDFGCPVAPPAGDVMIRSRLAACKPW